MILAGGSGCNEVKLFECENFTPIVQIKGLSRAPFTLDWHPSGEQFAIAGGDGVIRMFYLGPE